MKTKFEHDEQSIDTVNHAVSKFSYVSSTGTTTQPPRKKSKGCGEDQAHSKNQNELRLDVSQYTPYLICVNGHTGEPKTIETVKTFTCKFLRWSILLVPVIASSQKKEKAV